MVPERGTWQVPASTSARDRPVVDARSAGRRTAAGCNEAAGTDDAHATRLVTDRGAVACLGAARRENDELAALARANEQLRTENRRLAADRRRWAQLALFDQLTGLANRQLLEHSLDRALARAERNRATVGVFFIDLDRLKEINDRWGHDAGDRLLVAFAQRLRADLRFSDLAARWGGDEFVLVAEPVGHGHDTEVIAAGLLAKARGSAAPTTGASASVGVAICDGRHAITADVAVRTADELLYEAKAGGGDCYRLAHL